MDKKTTFILILMLVNLVFGGTELNGPVFIDNVPAYGSTATKYLIIDGSDSIVKSRTNTQVLSDIGGASIAALNLKLNISDTSVFARDVDLQNYQPLFSNKTGEMLVLNGTTALSDADAWLRFGNGNYDWRIKYVGSTGSGGGNEYRIESVYSGKYVQIDHDGNIEYFDGANIRNFWHSGNLDTVPFARDVDLALKEDTASNRLWRRVAPNTGVNTLTGFSATRSSTDDTGAPGSYFSVVHFNPVANTNKYDFDLASKYSNTSDFYLRAKHDTPDTNKVWCRLWTDNNLDTVPFARDGQAMTPVLHQHDSIYYRESEVNTLLNGKASTSHASTHLRGGSDVIAGEAGYGIYNITDTDAWYTGINYGGLGIGSNDGTNRQMMTFTDAANDTQAVFSVITSTDAGVNWSNKFKVTRSGRIKSSDIEINSPTSGAVSSPVSMSIGINQWSNGYTRDKLKLKLADGWGFTIGPNLDLQYHATDWHDFYNDNSKIFRIGKDSVVVNKPLTVHDTLNIYDPDYSDKMSIYYSNRSEAGIIKTPQYYGLQFWSGSTKYANMSDLQIDFNSTHFNVNANNIDLTAINSIDLTGNTYITGHQYINGVTSFTDKYHYLENTNNDGYLYFSGGTIGTGAELILQGPNLANGSFTLRSVGTSKIYSSEGELLLEANGLNAVKVNRGIEAYTDFTIITEPLVLGRAVTLTPTTEDIVLVVTDPVYKIVANNSGYRVKLSPNNAVDGQIVTIKRKTPHGAVGAKVWYGITTGSPQDSATINIPAASAVQFIYESEFGGWLKIN